MAQSRYKMHKYTDERLVFHKPKDIYDLVIDVERYPEFLPWCEDIIITKRSTYTLEADMIVRFHRVREKFTSTVIFREKPYKVLVKYKNGPFRSMESYWEFKPNNQGCDVDFYIEFALKNSIFSKVLTPIFSSIVKTTIESFSQRADDIYGEQVYQDN